MGWVTGVTKLCASEQASQGLFTWDWDWHGITSTIFCRSKQVTSPAEI